MTAADMFAQAHERLSRLGWTNETGKLRETGPRCVGLALADVCWAKAPHLMSVDNTPRRFLVAAIRERSPELADIEDKALVIHWNDHYCLDETDALEVLKRGEELARYGEAGVDVSNVNPDGSDFHIMNAIDGGAK